MTGPRAPRPLGEAADRQGPCMRPHVTQGKGVPSPLRLISLLSTPHRLPAKRAVC